MNDDVEQFKTEVKDMLSGYITNGDSVNYLTIKISKLYEKHLIDIREKEGEDS